MPAALPSLLVVTPTLGRSPWLAETIASVAQCAPDAKHVLVCPIAALTGLRKKFPRVTVRAEAGGGMYAAVNAGLTGTPAWENFTYLNDDDLLRPGIAAVRAALAAPGRPPAAFAYAAVELVDASGRHAGTIPVSRWPAHNRALYAVRLEPVYQHGTVVTRAAWEAVGGFDEHFRRCGDSEFLARLCVRGIPAFHVGGVAAAFRVHAAQLTQDRAAMVAERAAVDAKLGLVAPVPGRNRARLGFRLGNAGVYAVRVRQHGWIGFDELLVRLGRRQA